MKKLQIQFIETGKDLNKNNRYEYIAELGSIDMEDVYNESEYVESLMNPQNENAIRQKRLLFVSHLNKHFEWDITGSYFLFKSL